MSRGSRALRKLFVQWSRVYFAQLVTLVSYGAGFIHPGNTQKNLIGFFG